MSVTKRKEIVKFINDLKEIIEMIDCLSKKKMISMSDEEDYGDFVTFWLCGKKFKMMISMYPKPRMFFEMKHRDYPDDYDYYDWAKFMDIFEILTDAQKKNMAFHIELIQRLEDD